MKKRYIILILLLLVCLFSQAQEQNVRVVMKNGSTIVGVLKQIEPTDFVIIKVASIESKIKMSEILLIEPFTYDVTQTSIKQNESLDDTSAQFEGYLITDMSTEYPDSFTVQVAGQQFTMILVRGGIFNMGYDGRHSRAMKSEPIHKVELSSYYVSSDFIDGSTAYNLLSLSDKEAKKFKGKKFVCSWDDAKRIVDSIAIRLEMPYRMITEAEWEYASLSPVCDLVFGKTMEYSQYCSGWRETNSNWVKEEWCYDFFDEYPKDKQINPIGPLKKQGARHVARGFTQESKSYWTRIPLKHASSKCFVRFVISADKMPNTINEK